MVNIVVPLSEELRDQAELAARERGMSLDEFVRLCLSNSVVPGRQLDPLFADRGVFVGEAPADVAVNHDHYLYENRS